MNISISSPREQQGFMPSRSDSGATWHQEFTHQHSQAQRHLQNPVQGTGMGVGYGGYPQASGMFGAQQQLGAGQSQSSSFSHFPAIQQTQPEAFDEAAFARAFDEAAENEAIMHKNQPATGADLEALRANGMFDDILDQEALQNEMAQSISEATSTKHTSQSNDNLMEAQSNNLNLPRIGADSIRPQETERTQQEQQDAPDELARTAGNLLQSVQHDQSAKFQGSQFLELMRLLRDKEVAVRGDDFVGTNTADLEGDAERAVGDVKGARPSDYLDTFP
jgi:hypothetical protein